MSCILSASTITMPEIPDQDQIDLDLEVSSIADVIVHGRVTFCDSDVPVVGAIVKAIDAEGVGLCHTFSGCNGLYMLRLPASFGGQNITILVSCTNCPALEPCACTSPCPTA
ncbi:MAG TPA: hypothetical protein VFD17_01510 [Clostridia bacterium]|nr:hypothetical protein [Clostridia bacterium]